MGWWSSVKHFVKGVVRAVVKVVTTIVTSIIGAVSSIFLFWMTKKIRLNVVILRMGNKPLASTAEVEASVLRATALIKSKYNTKVLHYGNPYIQVTKENAPSSALGTECSGSGYASIEFGEAGSYFAKYTAGWVGIPISFTFPVTIFVVASITNDGDQWRGCSTGAMTDYVLITPTGLNDDTTLTHELSHSCNLLHRSNQNNLMYHGFDRGTSITGWQKWVFRLSRHVNYW